MATKDHVVLPRAGRTVGTTVRRQRTRGGSVPAVAPLRGLLPIVLALVLWSLLGSSDSFSFPAPTAWLSSLRELQEDRLVTEALQLTLRTFALGLLFATVAGVTLGCVIGFNRGVDRATSPLLDFFRALPPTVVVTVILLSMGPGYSSALLMVSIGPVWPIMLNTAAGVRAVPALRIEVSRTLGLSRRAHLFKLVLPSLTASILVGLRVATSLAFLITLFVEILGVTDGIGELMRSRQGRFDSAGVWGLLLVIGLTGYLINVFVALLERRLLRGWPTR